MKKTTLFHSIIACLCLIFAAFAAAPDQLEIGDKAPMTNVQVKDVSGEMLSLEGVKGENGLLVIFTCNTCPWVDNWEDRYNPIAKLAEEHKIGLIMLNPNTTNRNNGDSFQDMKERARKAGYTFPYALDENNKLADAFGATKTPDVFLFNAASELVYKGAIDDNARSAENVKEPYLKNAITALASGKEIPVKTTKALGCGIKRAR